MEILNKLLPAQPAPCLADIGPAVTLMSQATRTILLEGHRNGVGVRSVTKRQLGDIGRITDKPFRQTETGRVGQLISGSPHDDHVRLPLDTNRERFFGNQIHGFILVISRFGRPR